MANPTVSNDRDKNNNSVLGILLQISLDSGLESIPDSFSDDLADIWLENAVL